MTTRVTIDAHAGWPISVILVHGETSQPKTIEHQIVEPGTKKDYYLHSGLRIAGIEECPK